MTAPVFVPGRSTAANSPSAPPAGSAAESPFVRRHIGPDEAQIAAMLQAIGAASLDELIAQTVPESIHLPRALDLPPADSETEALADLRVIADKNIVAKSFIGMGYYGTIVPGVIQRNILENPGWYTQYTPYQAEIAQGRLEALLNFQTMVSDLTALPLANSSMLDEATAAAEAMNMCHSLHEDRPKFFVAQDCHPQTIAVVKSRAHWLGIELIVGDPELLKTQDSRLKTLSGVLVQYPTTDGRIVDYGPLTEAAHQHNTQIVAATDLLALTLIKPPGEWAGGGADIAVGSAQRFGVPMGFGGPHAAFMACKTEYTRKLPGRLVGVSKDASGNVAYRLALQTREQHIRREKATSNICTAQVLLAIMASMYAVYHGPEGLREIASRTYKWTSVLAEGLLRLGHSTANVRACFDTLRVRLGGAVKSDQVMVKAQRSGLNLREFNDGSIGISVDESTHASDIACLLSAFCAGSLEAPAVNALIAETDDEFDGPFMRDSAFLTHPVFHAHRSEHEMLRYIKTLESRDLSLVHSMIPLGSCTMKLNATSEMVPVTWPEFGNMHPYAPAAQTAGYTELFRTLEAYLTEITGFAAVSLQPNAGSQGEYAGLLAIRAYQASRGEGHRTVCLIPTSAHGTNPASAVIAGLEVVAVKCDARGNIDVADLRAKAAQHGDKLSCIMITYPSTHGVFEETVREICDIVHTHGGQVYMDGANMNAQVGLTAPGNIGADVCHLNLHKTFCIPHGGGGPGMGPIGVAKHLAPFLPKHPITGETLSQNAGENAETAGATTTQHSALSTQPPSPHPPIVISAAPFGSASILPISWMYIRMMGPAGLQRATEVAILNANYMAQRLGEHYPVLYRGQSGWCAHECIIDCRGFEETAGVKVEDIAKRLMDYGFHAPTMSWPVPGTLMIEPTESEAQPEMDRFCDAMIAIREEIAAIEAGRMPRDDNPLKNAPHTAAVVTAEEWRHPYTRQVAAFPAAWVREHKFWPAVSRIDNPYGDRNLLCTCAPVQA